MTSGSRPRRRPLRRHHGGLGGPLSRLERLAAATTTAPESGAPVDPPADPQVAGLLQEISELRLSAATNLTLAAAAMDAARPDIACQLIEAQQRDMAFLRIRAGDLLGLHGPLGERTRRAVLHDAAVEESALLEHARVPATKSLRKRSSAGVVVLPARREQSRASSRWSVSGALLAIAATIAVALVRPLAPPAPSTPDQMSASVAASLDAQVQRSYGELEQTARRRTPTFDVEQSARRLHASLAALLPAAAKDVVAARKLLDVLCAERVLLSAQAPDALDAFRAEAVRIVAQLRATAQPQVLESLPPIADIIGAVPSRIGGTATNPTRSDSSAGDEPATAGGDAGTGSHADSPRDDTSSPAHAPAAAPDPPVQVPPTVVTDNGDSDSSGGGGGGGGGDGGGTSSGTDGSSSSGDTAPALPDPLPKAEPDAVTELPANIVGDLPLH